MKRGVCAFLFSAVFLYIGFSFDKQDFISSEFSSNKQFINEKEQEFCGFDAMFRNKGNGNVIESRIKAIEQQVQIYLKNKPQKFGKNPPYVFLPVVVHIIHQNGPENISDIMVQQGIDDLNESFANLNYYDQGTGSNTYIQFCLATTDPAGNPSSGINRVVSPLSDFTMETQNVAVKALSFWNSFDYVNLWLVNEICSNAVGCGVAGYATFPGAHGNPIDGCVIEARFFGSNKPNSAITSHELGHYLGLYHTFEGGCTNSDCTAQGDRVCDTPPDQSTAISLCSSPPNTCNTDEDDLSGNNPFRPIVNGGLGDQNDMIINYMDYGDRNCYSAFTQGQADRMMGFVQTTRASLLANSFCTPTCSTPYSASFTASSNPVTLNSTVNFTNTSSGGTTYEWLIDGVPFATTSNSSYPFSAVGTFTITLNVTSTDPLCFETFEMEIEVTCFAQAAFTPSATSIFLGNSVTFTNNSTGAISYEWIVNNNSVSSVINYTHTFNTAGNIPVMLVANGIGCSDTTLTYISVNTQEDCENGIDDDGDGYIDCYDPNCVCNESDCSVSVLPTNFAARLAWRSDVDLASVLGVPMVGNLNPLVDSMPEIAIITNGTNEVLLFQGDGSNDTNPDVLSPGGFEAYPATNVGLADVNADQVGELAIVGADRRIRVFTDFVAGNNPPMTLMATSTGFVQHSDNKLSFADFNSDGISEIYSTNSIFQFDFSGPVTLNNVVSGTGAGGVFSGGGFVTDFPSNPVAVDILSVADCGGDPDCEGLELVGGYHIYSVDLDPNDGDPVEMKIQRDLRVMESNPKFLDGYTVTADVNLDGNLDVAVATRIAGNHMIYVYDKNGLIEEFSVGTTTSAGIITIANVFDDTANGFANDYPEILICAKEQLLCFNLNAAVANPVTKAWWILPTDDKSGVTGSTVFDFNGDKIYEIVYRDETDLRILYGGPAPFPVGVDLQRNWYTYEAFSRTYDEYPIVADVDNDNESEIIFTAKVVQGTDYAGRLQVLESDLTIADPWLPSRACWNQYGYFGLNINEDLTVPANQQQHHLEFPVGSGLYPYNNYLAQVPDLDENFDPYLPVADATIFIDTANCQGTTLDVTITICNNGYRLLPDSLPVTFYPSDPTTTPAIPITTQVTGINIAPDSCKQVIFSFPNTGVSFLCATVNDNGTLARPYDLSTDFPMTSILECDFTNNLDHIAVDFSTNTLSLGPDITICQSSVTPLDAGQGFQSYLWQDGSTAQTFTAFTAGTYSVTVADNCGNIQTDAITITMTSGGLNGLMDATLCGGGTITVSVPGGYTNYSWLPTIGVNCPTCPTVTITATIDTVYVVTAFDNNNCAVFDSIRITVLNTAEIARDTVSICNGESVIIHGNLESIPGNYIDTITIPGSCDSLDIVTLIVNDNPTLAVTPTNTSCTACIGLADLTISGGTVPFSFIWSNGATTEDISGLCEGTYTATVTDVNGCENTSNVFIQNTYTFGISFIGVDNQVTCNGACDGAGTVTATGGQTPYTYQWGNGATTTTITGLCAGAYPVTVTDTNGCVEVIGIVITEPTAITINIALDGNVSCNGLSDGSATATANGGVPPYTYQWDNGETTASVTNLDAGTHVITITDDSNCATTSSIQIAAPTLLSATAALDDNVSCNGLSDGGATATASGGTTPYSYQWDNGETTQSATMLSAGTHNVTITDDNNCSTVTTVTVTEPTALFVTTTLDSNVSCNGLTDGGATANASGGTTPYTYQWDNGEISPSATMLDAGNHSITVTDGNNCTTIATITITAPSILSATAVLDKSVGCNGNDGRATVTTTGGTTPYTYQWDNGELTTSATMLTAGNHSVTVTDDNNCTVVTSVIITSIAGLNATVTIDNNVSCNGLSDGGATVTVTGGTTPYTYQWDNGETNPSATMLNGGNHSITVTDSNNCTVVSSVTIATSPGLITSITVDNHVSCNGLSDGGAIVSVTGGSLPYTYQWDNGETNPSATMLNAGTHSVTVTDDSNCTAVATITITEPMALSATAALNNNVSCNGLSDASATVVVTGGTPQYTYLWDNGESNATATMLDAGNHSITVTDNNNCTVVAIITITEPTILSATAVLDNSVGCNVNDGGATVTATGGTLPYTYQWGNGETTQSATMLSAGTHDVTVADANNCIIMTSVTVTSIAGLSATVSVDNNVSCNGLSDGGATIVATGGTIPYVYQWDNGETSASATLLNSGVHSVTVTDANNCITAATITITEPAVLSTTAVLNNTTSCNGLSDGGATVTATGGTPPYTYQWDNGETNSSATMLGSGIHSVTVTDSNSCTATATITITEPAVLSATAVLNNTISCNGLSDGGATVTATGGTPPYTYQWDNGETNPSATMLSVGMHNVTVTDGNSCTTAAAITITAPAVLSATAVLNNTISCNSLSDGGATVTATGGTPPYTYQWDNGETNPSATMLSVGMHNVTVTDGNSCTTAAAITITEPAVLSATAVLNNTISCNSLSDGGATVTATGGTSPYTYQWDNGEITPTATMLSAGIHSITVTDGNNCTATTTITITEPALLSATAVLNNNVSCNSLSDGGAIATGTGGTMPYTYLWDNGETNPSATMLNTGIHSVTVTDGNSCTTVATITITAPAILSATAVLNNNVSCNGSSDGVATVTATGGAAPYDYLWDNGETNPSATLLGAGNHTVTVTDSNNCKAVASVTISEPNALSASAIVDNDVSCNGLSDGGATVTVTGGTTPYAYLWDNSETTPSATMLDAGIHNITITDANGCITTASVTITAPGVLMVATAVLANVSCNGFSDGSATVAISGGTGPFAFIWSNGETTATATGLVAGTSTVTVTDGNGCATNGSVLLTQPQVLVSNTTTTNVSCNGGSNGNATVAVSGGTIPYSYAWSNGQMTAQLINVGIGTYSYTVTDVNGCTSTGSVIINEPSAMNGNLIVSYSNCSGHINLQVSDGTAPYVYNWSNGGTTEDISNLPDGVYSVVVVDDNGCSWTGNATVIVANVPISTNAVGTNLLCNGDNSGSINLTILAGNPPYSIDWDNAPDVEDPTGLPAGTYTVTVTDLTGCTGTASVSLSEPQALSAIAIGTLLDCNGDADGTITLTVNGGVQPYAYNWDNAPNVQNPFGLMTGNYNVTVTDANGCTTTAGTSIMEPTALTGTIATSIAGCAYECSGTATYTALGGTPPYTYAWSDGQATPTVINLCVGSYTVSATDGNGCVIAQAFTIGSHPSISSSTSVVQGVICSGDNNGVAELTIVGGIAPFTVLWSSGNTGTIASGLTAGLYTVSVTDANGCKATSSVQLTDPTTLTAVLASTGTQCLGSLDGTATANTAGGVPPYTYLWDNGETSNPAIVLGGGQHMVSIADSNGCMIVESVGVNSPIALGLGSASTSPPTCDGVSDGSATVLGSGGTPPYTYHWDTAPPSTGTTVNGLGAGVVNVTITDANGCNFPVSLTVADGPTAIDLQIIGMDPLCFGSNDGMVSIVATGGTPSYTYLWNNGQIGQTIFGLTQGTYTVTVIDGNGCLAVASIGLTHPPLTAAALLGTDVICYGESNGGLAIISATGGTGMLEYSLDGLNYQTDSLFNGLSAGMYTVYVRDDNGCVTEFVQNVYEPAEILVDTGPDIEIVLGDSVQLDAVTNHSGPVVWTWNTGEYLSCTDCADPWVYPLETVTYGVMVVDSNGCTASDDVAIIVNKERNVFIPNTFTPNGDGVNDILHVFGDPSVSNINIFTIYDRWGESLFTVENVMPNDPTFGWDGQFKGKEMNSAVFVYYAEVSFIDGEEKVLKGSVTLLR